jgi:redox-sensitive bicupin YhaK (pirin superfamily)
MTAGTGIRHSEFNRGSDTLKLFQIWFEPSHKGCTPGYAMRRFPDLSNCGNWVVLASGLSEADDSGHLPMAAPARVLGCHVASEQRVSYVVREKHDLYVVVSRGEMFVNGLRVGEGDGVAVSDEPELRFESLSEADVVVAEMA